MAGSSTGNGKKKGTSRTSAKGSSSSGSTGRSSSSKKGSSKSSSSGTRSGGARASSAASGRSSGGSRKASSGSRQTSVQQQENAAIRRDIILIVMFAVTVFLFLCNFMSLGLVGTFFSNLMFGLTGSVAYGLPIFIFAVYLYYFLASRKDPHAMSRLLAVTGLFVIVMVLAELISVDLAAQEGFDPVGIYTRSAQNHSGGGLIGGAIAFVLYSLLRTVGTVMVLIVLAVACVYVIGRRSYLELVRDRAMDARLAREERIAEEERYREEHPEEFEDDYEDDYTGEYEGGYGNESNEADDSARQEDTTSDRSHYEESRERYQELRRERENRRRKKEEERRRQEELARIHEQEERDRRILNGYSHEDGGAAAIWNADLSADPDAPWGEVPKDEIDIPWNFERPSEAADEAPQYASGSGNSAARGPVAGQMYHTSGASESEGGGQGVMKGADSFADAPGAENSRRDSGAYDGSGADPGAWRESVSSDEGGMEANADPYRSNLKGDGGRETAPPVYESEDLHEIRPEDYEEFPEWDDIWPEEGSGAGRMMSGDDVSGSASYVSAAPLTAAPGGDPFSAWNVYPGERTDESCPAGAESALSGDSPRFAEPAPDAGMSFGHGSTSGEGTDRGPEDAGRTADGNAPVKASTEPEDNPAHTECEEAEQDDRWSLAGEDAPELQDEPANTERVGAEPNSNQSFAEEDTPGPENSPVLEELERVGAESEGDRSLAGEDAAEPDRNQSPAGGDAPGTDNSPVREEREYGGAESDVRLRPAGEDMPQLQGVPVHTERDGEASELNRSLAQEDAPQLQAVPESRGAGCPEAGEASGPSAFRFPPIDLLRAGAGPSADSDEELRRTAHLLQTTLGNFGVNVTITDISQGPSVTRYELLPEMGVKVSKIVSLADDIKLALAATDIRIEAPIPGKSAIGIEVPNREAQTVMLRDIIDTPEFRAQKSKLAFAVGKDIAGKPVYSDIARMPHVLIAGATGSGKSVCVNTIIISILYHARPDEVKFILIDPKVVELSVYNGIPHLLIPVVTDPQKATSALNWAVAEMEARYRTFADVRVREIKAYNAMVQELNRTGKNEDHLQKMPQIIVIVDELADLMMAAKSDVETAICRLAQLARAAGIHLIIATQRPSVDVITGLIKANMPSRIAFRVSSGVDSRTILDMNGAEKLLGKGDMLFFPQGLPKPNRVQGGFVSDDEVNEVVKFLQQNAEAAGGNDGQQREMMEAMSSGSSSGPGGAPAQAAGPEVDELFGTAGSFIIEKNNASIGLLQRRYRIGFNRAARIMDQLCDAGVVGESEGTRSRTILMTPGDFAAYCTDHGIVIQDTV